MKKLEVRLCTTNSKDGVNKCKAKIILQLTKTNTNLNLFQALQADMEQGHNYLKTMREKTDRVMAFLEEHEAEQLKEEVETRLFQLEELMTSLRTEHSSLEKCISLSKDFMDKYKAQAQWVMETKNLLASGVEPKAELYQKKAQLAKYKVHFLN